MPKQLLSFAAFIFAAATAFSQDTLVLLNQERHSAVSAGPGTGSNPFVSIQSGAASNDPIYQIKPKVEIPAFAVVAGWTFYGFAQISKKESTPLATVMKLQKSDIPWYDRWAARPYNRSVDKISYLPFDAAMPYPLIFCAFDKKMRKDYLKLTFLYAEAMAITGAIYTSGVHYFSRLRPLVYSSESPIDVRTSSNSRNSFFAGHVALVATSTFFMASAYADYHPDSQFKWVMYGVAGVATLTTACLRSLAGEHNPSDILVGTIVGTASGLLVPRLHQAKLIKNQRLSILPFAGRGQGLALFYKL